MKKEDKLIERKEEKSQKTELTKRRDFLKKAAYSAPTLIVLGELLKPTKIHADGTGGPKGPPKDWGQW